MNKDWFVDWFNTSYYHTLYQHRDESEACRFIDNLCAHLKIEQGAKILDLACGKGRHAIHLANKGFQTTGVDLAEESINKAKENAVAHVKFDVHDMRKPYIKNEFDYVFNLFTSFGYFDDSNENIDVLKAVAENLNSNGVFVLDFLNVKKVIPNLVPSETKVLDGLQFDIRRTYNGKHIIKDILVKDAEQVLHFQERVRAIDLANFQEMAKSAELQIVAVFGDYDLNEFNASISDRLILVMRNINPKT